MLLPAVCVCECVSASLPGHPLRQRAAQEGVVAGGGGAISWRQGEWPCSRVVLTHTQTGLQPLPQLLLFGLESWTDWLVTVGKNVSWPICTVLPAANTAFIQLRQAAAATVFTSVIQQRVFPTTLVGSSLST